MSIFHDLFSFTPIGALVNVIKHPHDFGDQYSNVVDDLKDKASTLTSDPVKVFSDEVSAGFEDIKARADDPTGYICDNLGIKQPKILDKMNSALNGVHHINQAMDYASGKDLKDNLKQIKKQCQVLNSTYKQLLDVASTNLQYYSDLALANVVLSGIPKNVLADNLPELTLTSVKGISNYSPKISDDEYKSHNLFDIWKAGGSKDLPDGLNKIINASRYALPTSFIWTGVASKVVNLLSFKGRSDMQDRINKWKNFSDIITTASQQAGMQVESYRQKTLEEAKVYVAFAKLINQSLPDHKEKLTIPGGANASFKSLVDMHDRIFQAQHNAEELLSHSLDAIKHFSSYMKNTLNLTNGYMDYLKQHHTKEDIDTIVEVFLNSNLAMDSMDKLKMTKAETKHLLIILTFNASVHLHGLILEGMFAK